MKLTALISHLQDIQTRAGTSNPEVMVYDTEEDKWVDIVSVAYEGHNVLIDC